MTQARVYFTYASLVIREGKLHVITTTHILNIQYQIQLNIYTFDQVLKPYLMACQRVFNLPRHRIA